MRLHQPRSGQEGLVVTIGAGFASPQGVVTDAIGNVFVADTGNNALKEISNADYDSPREFSVSYSAPTAVSVDANGRVYIIDANGIRMLTP
jgi:large repetitive protein